MTDQQIGSRLGISSSTVNSYWVRIRGKVGHHSRTELVSTILQKRSASEVETLRGRIQELEGELTVLRTMETLGNQAPLLVDLVESLPESVFVLDRDGAVTFATAYAERQFAYERGKLIGVNIEELVRPAGPVREPYFKIDDLNSAPKRLGIDHLLMGFPKSGSSFRVFMILQKLPGQEGTCSCIVRSVSEEIDKLRRNAAAVVAAIR